MSWGTCYTGSNNIHFNFPPIMADGRNFASWQPGSVINEKIRQESGIKTNWQYRKYLMENADQIIKYNQLGACNECSSTSNYSDEETINKSNLVNSQPFGYENSDLKNSYLSRQQLQERMITPVITQDQLLMQKFRS
jgi:hypothetical protein